jgi:hypothetical protein
MSPNASLPELPNRQATGVDERSRRLEWVKRLFGSDGDGCFPSCPIPIRHRPEGLQSEN